MSSYANGIRYSERIFAMKNHPLRRDRLVRAENDTDGIMNFEFIYSAWWAVNELPPTDARMKKQIEAHPDFDCWLDPKGAMCDCCNEWDKEYETDAYGNSICQPCWKEHHCDECYEVVRDDIYEEELYWDADMKQHLCQDCHDDRKEEQEGDDDA